jgi:hypothetical protein
MAYTNKDMLDLMGRPGVCFQPTYNHFKEDKRLTEPFSIVMTNDAMESFCDFLVYPAELADVFYYNGY